MAWIALVVSGVRETVRAAALSRSRRLARPLPSVVFGVALGEPATATRLLCPTAIVGGVVGLKVLHQPAPERRIASGPARTPAPFLRGRGRGAGAR